MPRRVSLYAKLTIVQCGTQGNTDESSLPGQNTAAECQSQKGACGRALHLLADEFLRAGNHRADRSCKALVQHIATRKKEHTTCR